MLIRVLTLVDLCWKKGIQLRRHSSIEIFETDKEMATKTNVSLKWQDRQVYCPGRHWRRWRQALTFPVTTRAVILTTFPFQWLIYRYKLLYMNIVAQYPLHSYIPDICIGNQIARVHGKRHIKRTIVQTLGQSASIGTSILVSYSYLSHCNSFEDQGPLLPKLLSIPRDTGRWKSSGTQS